MRHFLFLFFMLVCFSTAFAQRFEVGAFAGGANYIGDVGSTFYVKPNTPVGGFLAKWNQSSRYAFRFSLLFAEIKADDANSNETRRKQRGYSFKNHIGEASLGIEFNFWEFDLTKQDRQSTPYLYTGITYFNSKHQYLNADRPNKGSLQPQGDNWSFAVPLVFGYKQTITQRIIAGAEVGVRYTFTDDLDGSTPEEFLGHRAPKREFGNTNTNDWYVFSGITLTFTFGKKSCYSNVH